MRSVNRWFLAISAVAVAALMLGLLTSPGTAQNAVARTTTIRVREIEYRFTLSSKSAPRGRVTFAVKNAGIALHDFKIDGKRTRGIDAGGTARLTVNFTKPGKYPYRCTFDGHAALGMRGVFTIR